MDVPSPRGTTAGHRRWPRALPLTEPSAAEPSATPPLPAGTPEPLPLMEWRRRPCPSAPLRERFGERAGLRVRDRRKLA